MKIWIVTIYEPLPFGAEQTRPQRCGMLARELLARGHTVELWTSSFNHIAHKHHYRESLREKINEQMSIQFIKGSGYSHDQSVRRYFHNRQTAREFLRLAARRSEIPDLIFAPIPIPELAEAAVKYAASNNIPAIIDFRDLWPDVYLSLLPRIMHPIGAKLLFYEYRRVRQICAKAYGITAISRNYMQRGLAYAERDLKNTDKIFPLGSPLPCICKSGKSKSPEILREYSLCIDDFVVSYVGTFSNFIDIGTILKAASFLAKNKKIRIMIVGAGKGAEKFQRMAGKLSNVVMTGWLNSVAIQNILSISDVGLVAYSRGAIMSLPNKPFEYMAAGLPLLSSLPGELSEIIDQNCIGRNYEPGDAVSLASGIQWFFDHREDARRMGEKSLVVFNAKYKSDLVYKEFAEYVEFIVDNYKTRRLYES